MAAVGPQNGFDIVLIHIRVVRANVMQDRSLLIEQDDFLLDGQGDLGIRNHGRQKECVGGPAFRTFHPPDPQKGFPVRVFHETAVVPVDGKASMVAAGTFQPVKRKKVNDRFINIFGNIVAIFDSDGYHSIVADLSACRKSVGYDSRKARGGVSCYQSIQERMLSYHKRHHIKQSAEECNRIIYVMPSFNVKDIYSLFDLHTNG